LDANIQVYIDIASKLTLALSTSRDEEPDKLELTLLAMKFSNDFMILVGQITLEFSSVLLDLKAAISVKPLLCRLIMSLYVLAHDILEDFGGLCKSY